MKKIEKTYFIHEAGLENFKNGHSFTAWSPSEARLRSNPTIEVKVIYEEPEKKITISESEFDEMVKMVIDKEHILDELKYNLFFGSDK